MNLLIVAVEDREKVQDFLSVLVELDVAGLQVMDSSTVMEILAREAPIFAGLRQLITRPTAESKMIFGVVQEDDILPRLDRLLKRVDLDLDEPGNGYAMLLPIAGCIGSLDFEGD